MIDPLVENSRQVRDQLLKQFGGLPGLCDKLEAMDRTRERKAARKRPSRRPSQAATPPGSKAET